MKKTIFLLGVLAGALTVWAVYADALVISGAQDLRSRNLNVTGKNITDVNCLSFSDGEICNKTALVAYSEADENITSQLFTVLQDNYATANANRGVNGSQILTNAIFARQEFGNNITSGGDTWNMEHNVVLDSSIGGGYTLQIRGSNDAEYVEHDVQNSQYRIHTYAVNDVNFSHANLTNIGDIDIRSGFSNTAHAQLGFFHNNYMFLKLISQQTIIPGDYNNLSGIGFYPYENAFGDSTSAWLIYARGQDGLADSYEALTFYCIKGLNDTTELCDRIIPYQEKQYNFGDSEHSWDTCYCDDFTNTPRNLISLEKYNNKDFTVETISESYLNDENDIPTTKIETVNYNFDDQKTILNAIELTKNKLDEKTYNTYIELLKDIPYNETTGSFDYETIPIPLRDKQLNDDTISTMALMMANRNAILELEKEIEDLKRQCQTIPSQ